MLKTKFIFHIQFRFTNLNQLNFSHTVGPQVESHKLSICKLNLMLSTLNPPFAPAAAEPLRRL